ncbi:hypothetical protein SAMN02745163_03460 [Clostridium cavendishii DSM 21758]|uniref:GyrI-like small molecule binding domain-containing protein n=1 Tax=Clostridium cavendishii DSM 21758 TaxID=1121302 RepID=A0A1M6QUY0_9CLOT|nr:GyrI-like domain-containing protein [Clostridium cavendishii]SHK23933.1 hypothetical protein SAMN02745163_03460 [Clostridium cavendishii DSM 21758]
MSEKLDLKKQLKDLYGVKQGEFKAVKLPKIKYIAIDGKGNPNESKDYKLCLEALYKIAYSIKFTFKNRDLDFVVPSLSGLWYMENNEFFNEENKDKWQWTMMVAMPDYVQKEDFEEAKKATINKHDNSRLKDIKFIEYDEGLVMATLYVGSYSEERETLEKMYGLIEEKGYKFNGKHHEIYLSDPRRVEESRLKTILIQPII